MNEQEFRKLLKKQQAGNLTKEEEYLLHVFESKLLRANKSKVFNSNKHRKKIKTEALTNINDLKESRFNYRFLSVAASIALFISVSLVVYFYSDTNLKPAIAKVENLTKQTSWGQKMMLTLSDGTKVKLNAGSKLIFPKVFSDSIREVTLEGEAFFDVTHNAKKPFVIHSGDLKTTVLGTTFNIEAYPDNLDVKITLATGKVKVQNLKQQSFLKPSEQAVFNKKNNSIISKKVDIEKYLEWKEGVLRFENSTLAEAAKKLEKWYNVTIEFENENAKHLNFTGKFKNEPLQVVLKSMAFVTNKIDYHFESKNKVIIN